MIPEFKSVRLARKRYGFVVQTVSFFILLAGCLLCAFSGSRPVLPGAVSIAGLVILFSAASGIAARTQNIPPELDILPREALFRILIFGLILPTAGAVFLRLAGLNLPFLFWLVLLQPLVFCAVCASACRRNRGGRIPLADLLFDLSVYLPVLTFFVSLIAITEMR